MSQAVNVQGNRSQGKSFLVCKPSPKTPKIHKPFLQVYFGLLEHACQIYGICASNLLRLSQLGHKIAGSHENGQYTFFLWSTEISLFNFLSMNIRILISETHSFGCRFVCSICVVFQMLHLSGSN